MKITSAQAASMLRPLTCAGAVLLAGALSLGCVAGAEGDWEQETVGEAADALSGWYAWYHGTTDNDVGIDLEPTPDEATCVLSGVAGNLSVGSTWFEGRESMAFVRWQSGKWNFLAHGGAYSDNLNHTAWAGNPVNGHATCFYHTANRKDGSWDSQPAHLGVAAPVKIAELSTTAGNTRQCFLSGVWGVHEVWETTRFARVVKKTTTDANHPTTGWYVEGNMPDSSNDGSHAVVLGRCVDFPSDRTFTSGQVTGTAAGTPVTITSGSGVKGCALTEISGVFNQNSWTDGALITAPSTLNGNWTITVSNNKSARWACVE